MTALVSRDPFARTELHRETVYAPASTCAWCGSARNSKKLFRYRTESDGGRVFPHIGLFCSVGCFRSFAS